MSRITKWADKRSDARADFNSLNDKLDLIIDGLERLSEELLYIAKYDDYKKIFDDQMGNPMEELDSWFGVKNEKSRRM